MRWRGQGFSRRPRSCRKRTSSFFPCGSSGWDTIVSASRTLWGTCWSSMGENWRASRRSPSSPGDGLYERAFEKLLIARKGQRSQLQLLALRLRSRMAFLRRATPLHIFVVTLRCEHSCPYCQVSRQSTDRIRFDMSEETAMRAVEVASLRRRRRSRSNFRVGSRCSISSWCG